MNLKRPLKPAGHYLEQEALGIPGKNTASIGIKEAKRNITTDRCDCVPASNSVQKCRMSYKMG